MESPDQTSAVLSLVHQGWDYVRTKRPLAAWACWKRALRLDPGNSAATEAIELLSSASELPAALKVARRFKPPRDDERRKRWDVVLSANASDDLERVAGLFRALASADAEDLEALYNEALALAWSGNNARARQRFDEYGSRVVERDREAAIESFVLAEFLAQGGSTELEFATEWTHAAQHFSWRLDTSELIARLRSIVPLVACRTSLDESDENVPPSAPRALEWLDRPMPEQVVGLSADELPRVVAGVIATPRLLRFSSTDRWRLKSIEWTLAKLLGGISYSVERTSSPLPIRLMDAAVWTFRVPLQSDDDERARLTREAVERFYEDHWVRQPRRGPIAPQSERIPSLAASSRLAGSASPSAAETQARIEAAVRVRDQLANRPMAALPQARYPFDRLRNRLGLKPENPDLIDPADVSCMSDEQLEKLDTSRLDPSLLRDAFRSAHALLGGSRPTTVRLARELIDRDPTALAGEQATAVLNVVVRQALGNGDVAGAITWLDRFQAHRGAAESGLARRSLGEAWRAAIEAAEASSVEREPGRVTSFGEQWEASVTLACAARLVNQDYLEQALPLIMEVYEQCNDPEIVDLAFELLMTDPLSPSSGSPATTPFERWATARVMQQRGKP